MTTQQKQALLAIIASGNTKEVFDQLLDEGLSKKLPPSLQSTVIMLASKYNKNEAANSRAILTQDEYKIEQARITNHLIAVINGNEKIPKPILDKKKVVTFSTIALLIFISLFFYSINTSKLETSGANSPIIKDANDVSINFGVTEIKQDTTHN